MAAMRPSRMATSPETQGEPVPSIRRPLRITRSYGGSAARAGTARRTARDIPRNQGQVFICVSSGPRMEAIVERFEPLLVDVSIDLGGRYVGVAEHGLHRAEIGAVLQQMGGEAVAQDVRRDLADAGFEAVALEVLPEAD